MTVPGPEFGQDPAMADWVGERLTGEIGQVTGTVPAGFAAYARILHPTTDPVRPASWAEVAAAAGTQVHPQVQWHTMARRVPGTPRWWDELDPEEGNLHPTQLRALLSVLRNHTGTPDRCWFCLWIGYGWMHGSPSIAVLDAYDDGSATEREIPPAYPAQWLSPALQVRHPSREYLLGTGPLDAALGIGRQISATWFDAQSPNVFWPEDRQWCVATEIDFDSTLVAGSDALIDELVHTPLLETFRIRPDDSLRHNADHVNDGRSDNSRI